MSTNMDTYRQELLFALRMRNVPAARIGEAIAEVESHVADTNEDPVDAFGEPAAYAQRLAESLAGAAAQPSAGTPSGGRPSGGTPSGGRWTNAVAAVASFAGAAVAATGLLRGDAVTTAMGVVLLGGLAIWLFRRRSVDRIVDPRTGTALRFPAPRWALAVFAVSMAALVIIAVSVR